MYLFSPQAAKKPAGGVLAPETPLRRLVIGSNTENKAKYPSLT